MSPSLLKHWKKIALALALTLSFAAGYWSNDPQSSTKTTETTSETASTSETESKNNDKIKVVTQKPDGSIEVVEIDKSKKKKTKDTNTAKETEKTKEVIEAKSQHRAGVWVEKKNLKDEITVYGFEYGRRVFGNFWGSAGINTDKEVKIGLSYEW